MLFQRAAFALAAFASLATASPFWPVSPRQSSNICLPGQDIQTIYIISNVVVFPIYINQTFSVNTVLNIGGTTIIINNAPTYINTFIQATTTTETTSTMTATTTQIVTVTATPFVLAAAPTGAAAKRQANGNTFVSGSGGTVGRCSDAAVFTIEFDQLKSGGQVVSTDPGTLNAPFAVSPTVGAINTQFTFNAGELVWTNGLFFNGNALFCSQAGSIYAVFNGVYPAGCTPQGLTFVRADSCASIDASSTQTGTSSTTGTPTGSATTTNSASSTGTSSTVTIPTSSTSSTTSSATNTASVFAVAVTPSNGSPGSRKRQSGTSVSYLAGDGSLSSSANNSATFFLTGGQLFEIGGQVSVNSTAGVTLFAASANVGDITGTFTNSNGMLVFNNSIFTNGVATYCTANNFLYIVGTSQPSTCANVALQVVPPVASPTSSVVSSTTMSSTTQGATTTSANVPTSSGQTTSVTSGSLTSGTTTTGSASTGPSTTGSTTSTSPPSSSTTSTSTGSAVTTTPTSPTSTTRSSTSSGSTQTQSGSSTTVPATTTSGTTTSTTPIITTTSTTSPTSGTSTTTTSPTSGTSTTTTSPTSGTSTTSTSPTSGTSTTTTSPTSGTSTTTTSPTSLTTTATTSTATDTSTSTSSSTQSTTYPIPSGAAPTGMRRREDTRDYSDVARHLDRIDRDRVQKAKRFLLKK